MRLFIRVIVGGGRIPDEIADRFVELAGGAAAKIVVVPTASADAAARATCGRYR